MYNIRYVDNVKLRISVSTQRPIMANPEVEGRDFIKLLVMWSTYMGRHPNALKAAIIQTTEVQMHRLQCKI